MDQITSTRGDAADRGELVELFRKSYVYEQENRKRPISIGYHIEEGC